MGGMQDKEQQPGKGREEQVRPHEPERESPRPPQGGKGPGELRRPEDDRERPRRGRAEGEPRDEAPDET
ncbi:hypothetical protein ACGF1Z_12245 [Streptomyces sp. NPDC048018]|uniref:hypothetical protein n=1 Tax=Streptomyces sp. NPDC048018 TaxID=3365499 RepID=UPI0037196ED4